MSWENNGTQKLELKKLLPNYYSTSEREDKGKDNKGLLFFHRKFVLSKLKKKTRKEPKKFGGG
jgi:hypothetical protein